jgi:hypothetical protein
MTANASNKKLESGKKIKIFLGMGGAVNGNLKAHLERTNSKRWAETQLRSFKDLTKPSKNSKQCITQMGSGYITNSMRLHIEKNNSHQWIDQPLNEFAQTVVLAGFGTGGISPAVIRHLSDSATKAEPAKEMDVQVIGVGTGSISPAVVRHLSGSASKAEAVKEMNVQVVGFGTAGISPAVVKHLAHS